MSTLILGASLKMYFSHARTVDWVREVCAAAAAVAPPAPITTFLIPQYPSLPASIAITAGTGVAIGAQDVAAEDSGAFTGEVSGAVLQEIGCRYAEVGHAERRRLFGETDEIVARKTHAALRNGLIPVLCVGEAEPVPAAEAARSCAAQVDSALAPARAAGIDGPLVVAYEPLWAIGAPQPAGPDHIRDVCARLRTHLDGSVARASIIYGGSAGPGLLSRIVPDVDGLFLGRFAHDPAAFRKILDEAAALVCPGRP